MCMEGLFKIKVMLWSQMPTGPLYALTHSLREREPLNHIKSIKRARYCSCWWNGIWHVDAAAFVWKLSGPKDSQQSLFYAMRPSVCCVICTFTVQNLHTKLHSVGVKLKEVSAIEYTVIVPLMGVDAHHATGPVHICKSARFSYIHHKSKINTVKIPSGISNLSKITRIKHESK